MAEPKTSVTEPISAEAGSGLSRRDFLTTTVTTVTATMVGVLVAAVPGSANVQVDDVLRVFDHSGTVNNTTGLIHGHVSVRPASSVSPTAASASDELMISMTLKASDGKPVAGMRVTGHFGDAVTDKNGNVNLTGRMKDLVSVSRHDGSAVAFMPEDRNWDMFFNAKCRSGSIRIDSGLATSGLQNDGRPTTICTSGRTRPGELLTPVVVCLLVS